MYQREESDEIMQQILGRIGSQVIFTYPKPEAHRIGILEDSVVVASNPDSSGIPYWDVIDLIEFPNESEPKWMRIGYYRKPNARLVWASQTTITEPFSTWKKLLVHAAKEKPWFRNLLEDVMKELKNHDNMI